VTSRQAICRWLPTFWRNASFPSSRLKCFNLSADQGLFSVRHLCRKPYPEDGGETFLRNVCNHLDGVTIHITAVNKVFHVRFQILTAASMKMTVFWNTAPYSLVGSPSTRLLYTALYPRSLSCPKCFITNRLHGAISQKTVLS
jgi:hypothetical protein